MDFAAGQRWTYRTPSGYEASRIVVGAVVTFRGSERAVCVAIAGAPGRTLDGRHDPIDIPFLAFTQSAFEATVGALDGSDVPPAAFAAGMEAWAADSRGLAVFTVPFEGTLDGLIARQMAEIVGPGAVAIQ